MAISVRTRIDTTSWEVGERLLKSLIEKDARLCPELISKKDEDGYQDFVSFDGTQPAWASPATVSSGANSIVFHQDFEWRRKRKIKSEGSVNHTFRNIRSQILPASLWFKCDFVPEIEFLDIFRIWIEMLSPQIAMMHLFTQTELSQKDSIRDFIQGIFGAVLKPRAPDMAWAMFYGDEFSDVVDVNSLTEAGAVVEKIGNGYLVLISDRILDIVENFKEFAHRREQLKNLFPEDFFGVEDHSLEF